MRKSEQNSADKSHHLNQSNYKVPSSRGGFVQADPVKLCIKYKPPTIAVVYEILKPSRLSMQSPHMTTADSTIINATTESGISPVKKRKKHIHEIRLDELIFRESTSEDLGHLADKLFEQESLYLDPQTISRSQVMNLLQKIYDQLFPPIDRRQKSCDSAANNIMDDHEPPSFQNKSDIKQTKREEVPSTPDKLQLQPQLSASKMPSQKPGPIKAQRDIMPLQKNESHKIKTAKSPTLSDLKSIEDSQGSLTEEEQAKMINEQFEGLFDYDPDLYKVIPREEAEAMGLEERYHVINAYMRGGGIRGLIGGDEEEDDFEFSPQERAMIEEEFDKLYSEDARFKQVIGDAKPQDIPLRDKYELVVEYTKRYRPNEPKKDMGEEDIRVEGEFVFYKGKTYKRVKIDNDKSREDIDDEDDEYLMDEEGNIYDMHFRLIGRADNDEEEQEEDEYDMEMKRVMNEMKHKQLKGIHDIDDDDEEFDVKQFEEGLDRKLGSKSVERAIKGIEQDLDDYHDDFDDDDFNL